MFKEKKRPRKGWIKTPKEVYRVTVLRKGRPKWGSDPK